LRVNAMLNHSAFPGVMFANAFMRHFLIYDNLLEVSHSLQRNLREMDSKSEHFSDVEKVARDVESALVKQEKTIAQLLLAKHVSLTGKYSPRLENMIQFMSATREMRFTMIDSLQNAIRESSKDSSKLAEIESLERGIALQHTILT